MDRVEEVHADDPSRLDRAGGDLPDRQRGRVRGENRLARHGRLPLLQHRALDRELLDDGFDRHLARREAGVVEGARNEGHLRLHLAGSHPALGDGLAEDSRRGREAAGQSLRVDVLHAGGDALVRRELRDASAHHAGAENSQPAHGPGPRVARHARLLLDLLGLEEDPEQIPLDRAPEDVRDPPRLGLEPGLDGLAVRLLDDRERLEGRRIVAVGLFEHLLPRFREEELPADRVRLEREGSEVPRAPAAAGLRRPEPRRREVTGELLEDRRRNRLVHEPDALRALRVELLSGQDEVEGGLEAHEAGKPRAASPRGEEPEAHLGQADARLRRIGHEPVVAGERQLRAAAETDSVNRRDRRDRQTRELLEDRLAALDRSARLLGRDARKLLDVRAGDEDIRLAAPEEEAPQPRFARRASRAFRRAPRGPPARTC